MIRILSSPGLRRLSIALPLFPSGSDQAGPRHHRPCRQGLAIHGSAARVGGCGWRPGSARALCVFPRVSAHGLSPSGRRTGEVLPFTRYSYYQYCMVYSIQTGGRKGTLERFASFPEFLHTESLLVDDVQVRFGLTHSPVYKWCIVGLTRGWRPGSARAFRLFPRVSAHGLSPGGRRTGQVRVDSLSSL